MNRFLSYRLLPLMLMLLSVHFAMAQDSTAPALVDSTVVEQVPPESTLPDSTVQDTTVVSIEPSLRKISRDSLQMFKTDKGLAWQYWLDSSLRAEQALRKPLKARTPRSLPNLGWLITSFKVLLILLALAVVGFIVYRLFFSKNSLFIKNRSNVNAAVEATEPASADRYAKLIEEAEEAGDYRHALRYLHLQTLLLLAKGAYIATGIGKTNYQYEQELRQRLPVASAAFSQLTRNFEYAWYGEYAVSAPLYETLRNEYRHFQQQTIPN